MQYLLTDLMIVTKNPQYSTKDQEKHRHIRTVVFTRGMLF